MPLLEKLNLFKKKPVKTASRVTVNLCLIEVLLTTLIET